jgi:hypothetical protein
MTTQTTILRQKSYNLAAQIIREAEDGLAQNVVVGFTGPKVIEQVTEQIYLLARECYKMGEQGAKA